MKLKQLLIPLAFSALAFAAEATPVKVTMNAVSTTMALTPQSSETAIDVGSPTNKVYEFDTPAGEYVLTAYATDGKTVNGTIVLNIPDSSETQEFTVLTNTAYVTNKNEDNATWTIENGDYTIDVTVNTREGVRQTVTLGKSTTAGRYTFLAFNGNSYNLSFVPSKEHQAEGYTTLYKGGTLTFNVNAYGKIPMAADFSVTLPAEAELMIGLKFFHFINFTPVEPKTVENNGATKTVTYSLADAQVYNYRTWMKGGLTQAGYFTMNVDKDKCPVLNFTEEDFKAFAPEQFNHDVQSNQGYETGDVFVNINPEGHLKLNIGDTFEAHAMRTWELTDNSTNNYFMEPDFHYTVVGLDGKPSTGVIEIENANTTISPWSKIKAVGKGTAIVLVTYDAIGLNYYSGANKTAYLGGEYWGAIWPENTGVYVVTVGEDAKGIVPNMVINEEYNKETLKLAGNYVDAEHDVFYYLDTEDGATYTFTPENVAEVTIAYPTIGDRTVTYTGFSNTGVTKNDDGSYTLLLKQGRQIVKLTDSNGNATYQVLTAKKCHLEITNSSRPGSQIFQPGDGIKLQYSGLFHPANKIAGIYNMSAYVTYNGIPNGSSLILGSGQYTFGSAASAQAVTVTVPEDQDLQKEPAIVLSNGVIQVNGYGDPIGNHRNISPTAGRSPNFTAIAHKTYFGAIPDISIPLSAYKSFDLRFVCDVEDAEISVTFDGQELNANAEGYYTGTYGSYSVIASKEGYRCYRHTFDVEDNAEGLQTFNIVMEKSATSWNGKTLSEPSMEEGVYLISNGAELAWLADHVNNGNAESNARLINDIDLGNYDWTPIGSSSSKCYSGTFEGSGHKIEGVYINKPTVNYQGLFGYVNKGSISGVTVYGVVSGKQYVGGIAAYVNQNATIDRCANYANVSGTGTYVGGVIGSLGASTATLSNSYNVGNVSGTTNCGGVAGYNNATAVIENVFNIGEIAGATVGACVGGTTAKTNVKNAFAVKEYQITAGQTMVTAKQMTSGEVAYQLGEAFGQSIGTEEYPVINGPKVLYDEESKKYYNEGVKTYPVKVTMNTVSSTMSMTMKDSGKKLIVDEPDRLVYTFDAPAGEYILTAYGSDGSTVNGTIVVNVEESDDVQEFVILTNTVYVSNKNEDNTTWTIENGDYTLELTVNTREGERQTVTLGNSTTAGRYTFLAFNGNSYYLSVVPSQAHKEAGFASSYRNGTLTAGIILNAEIPKGGPYSVSVPADAELSIGIKFGHYTDFKSIEPESVEIADGSKVYTYNLADNQIYNFRSWKKDGLTHAGYFTMSLDPAKCPDISLSETDYQAYNPKQINHDPKSNNGYETGDIFVNINPAGHLKLNVGETFDAHAMRTWQLTNSTTANYFMEPDFHYTVVGLDGKPSTNVIEIDNADTTTSSWSKIKAVGTGTAIVLVSYDAIATYSYDSEDTKKSDFVGGMYWGAIWPENTGVYVVTVGEDAKGIDPNMVINEEYNKETLKLAGKYVDAEHDVFYYLDTEDGATYTFTPEGVENVTIAYPTISEQTVSYSGFGTDGVTKNDDGSYTLLLKQGRQIVKLTDAAGKSVYQVLTAKECHYEILNSTREGSKIFQPGDKVTVQYSGLFHPANKLSAIYNMSAYVTFNGVPNGTSLILSPNQYTFGSTASAQAVTVEIPEDYDLSTNNAWTMTDGVIQVNGYGDPIGNHRNISHEAGRSANFTAIAHKTYFGRIPSVSIPLTPVKMFDIKVDCNVADVDMTLLLNGQELTPDIDGGYTGTYGNYSIVVSKPGYRCFRQDYMVDDDAEGTQTFKVSMVALENGWDGKTFTEPELIDNVYQIGNGAELAWFAEHVNSKANDQDAVLTSDIDLGDYTWTPIGKSNLITYGGKFNGQDHIVEGLYINDPKGKYMGLFGYLKNAEVSRLTVDGVVSGQSYIAGIAGMVNANSLIDRCANRATISGSTNVGGITSSIASTGKVSNSYNVGTINTSLTSGGITGNMVTTAEVENVFSIGAIYSSSSQGTDYPRIGACIGSFTESAKISNVFTIYEYGNTKSQTLVTEEQMYSGEIAYLLGDAFGQLIGVDEHPVINGDRVFKVEYVDIDAIQISSDESPELIYTNGELPAKLNGEDVRWYTDSEMSASVTSVESDALLYVKIGTTTSIEDLSPNEEDLKVRWFDMRGIEVNTPKPGTKGIFIRVANGKSEKVIL